MIRNAFVVDLQLTACSIRFCFALLQKWSESPEPLKDAKPSRFWKLLEGDFHYSALICSKDSRTAGQPCGIFPNGNGRTTLATEMWTDSAIHVYQIPQVFHPALHLPSSLHLPLSETSLWAFSLDPSAMARLKAAIGEQEAWAGNLRPP